jgi:cholesterol oxidase
MIDFRFKESMSGLVTILTDSKPLATSLTFHLRVETLDFDSFLADPEHRAALSGTVVCRALSTKPMRVTNGTVEILVSERKRGVNVPGSRLMVYRLTFGPEGPPSYCLQGKKYMRSNTGFHVWRDTTTLFTCLYDAVNNTKLGEGILHRTLLGFARDLFTFRARPMAKTPGALSRFGFLFVGRLWDVYARDILDYCPLW